ncbi:MAG: DUF1822 family protein [Rhodocyclaceae bacterium]|nr:DUF1822 family protein [Rhodocyclaceae bacterium]
MPIECHRDVLRGGVTAFANAIAWPKRPATPRIVGDIAGTALTTLALTGGRVYCIPFVVPREVVISGLRVSVTGSSAGSIMLGIYESTIIGGTEVPYGVLAQLTAALDTSSGDKTGSFASNLTLLPGVIYWAALVAITTVSVRAVPVASIQTSLGRQVGNNGVISHIYSSTSGAVLPTPGPGTLTDGTGPIPAIYLIEV